MNWEMYGETPSISGDLPIWSRRGFCEACAMETANRITRDINQIARNFARLGEEPASLATADHVRRFWAPLLKAELASAFGTQPGRFSPIARRAIEAIELPPRAASVHSPMSRDAKTAHFGTASPRMI